MTLCIPLDEYLHSDERVYHQTRTEIADALGDGEKGGILAVTDVRLVFLDENRALDIDISAVEEIEYRPAFIPWGRILLAALFTLIGVWFLAGFPGVSAVPGWTRPFVILGTLPISAILAILAWDVYDSHLIVRTSQSEHRWKGGDLQPFSMTIRVK